MRTTSRWLASVAALALLCVVAPVSAQDEPGVYPAHIHAGNCDDPGEIEAPLDDLVEPTGEQLGADEAVIAASSFSIVSVTLDSLLSGDFAIDVHQLSEEEAIACGEIGGALDERGALTIGLRPRGDSGFSGVAYLTSDASDPSQTTLSTFLADTGVAAAIADEDSEDSGTEDEPDEQTYVVTVRRQVTLLVGSLQRVDSLFDDPRVDDDAWIDQLTAELTLWQILYDEARETPPPAAYADFHERYLAALELLDSASLDVFAALESGDQERLDEAGTKIDRAVELLRELSGGEEEATPAARVPVS